LLASIAVPNFLRSRKRSQATQVLEDLRLIDAAVDQYAIENNKKAGEDVTWTDVRNYLKTGTRLETSGGKDILDGVFITPFKVDTIPKVPVGTFNALSDVAPTTFWGPHAN
jgi:type II secretory pathway pseudopilin PulG